MPQRSSPCPRCGGHKTYQAALCRYCFVERHRGALLDLKKQAMGQRARDTSGCIHHWMLPEPSGPEVIGKCKLCKAARVFPTGLPALINYEVYRWNEGGGQGDDREDQYYRHYD
jgi:hypothetical protein